MSSCILNAVVDDHKESCSGNHTILRHGHHQGYLVGDGRLFCDTGSGQLQKCKLQWSSSNHQCIVLTDLKGHTHGPNCGHEAVPHEDHFDYLVDDELHHVVEKGGLCCPKQCVQITNSNVVSHGLVNIIRKGSEFISHITSSHSPRYTAMEIQTARPEVVTTTRIMAEGICCPSEVPVIQRTLNPLPGVYDVDVSVVTKTVIVEHDAAQVSPGVLVSALNGANLGASLASNYKINEDLKTQQTWKSWIPPKNILVCFLLLMLSLVQYAGTQLENFKWIALGSIFIGIWPILMKAYGALRACFMDIHILMTLAVVGAVAIGEYAEGAAVVFLFGLADWLEGKCTKHASNALAAVLHLQPDKALIAKTNSLVDVDEVIVGEIVVVKPGCKVPIDGVVCRGETLIDESMLTGESQPLFKVLGDSVMSGTLNTGQQAIDVQTTSLSVDSTACRIGNQIEEASRKKSPTERIVNNVAKYYTPSLLLATVFVIVIPFILNVDNAKEWVIKGLVLLVTACPCALVLSTPVTVVCGLARAAQKGVVIKGAQYLETLGRCHFMSFDKTGTLTRGQVELVHVGIFKNSKSAQEIVQLAASLESHSSHPLANAVLGYAAARGYNNWQAATVCESIPGQGIQGEVNAEQLSAFVGNQNMVQNRCPEADVSMLDALQIREKKGETLVFVGCNGELWGYLALKDKPRTEAKQALKQIQKFGVQVGMMTGDRKLVAYHVAEEMGIEKKYVGAELLPEQKLKLVEDVKKTHKLCHVGDGVNDGPALAAADVGVAMGVAGSAVAIETADIALFTSDLRQLAFALKLSRAAVRTIVVNVFFSVFIKISVIILAFTVGVNLWLAVLADVGSCITVILFSMTILNIDSKNTDLKEGCYANKEQNEKQCCDDHNNSCCANKNQNRNKMKRKSCCEHENFSENASILSGIIKSDEDAGNEVVYHHHNHHHENSAKKSCCGGSKNIFVAEKSCCKSVQKSPCCTQKNESEQKSCSEKTEKKSCCDKKSENIQKPCCESKKQKSCSEKTKKKSCCDKKSENLQKTCCESQKQICCSEKTEKKSCCDKKPENIQKPCCESEKQQSCSEKTNKKSCCDKKPENIQKPCCESEKLKSCCEKPEKQSCSDKKSESIKKACCGGGHGDDHKHKHEHHQHDEHYKHDEHVHQDVHRKSPCCVSKNLDTQKNSCCGSKSDEDTKSCCSTKQQATKKSCCGNKNYVDMQENHDKHDHNKH